MATWLKRVFSRTPNTDGQLGALRQALELKPDEIPLSGLLPIFVPSSFFESGNWPGPHELLRAPGLGLTWSIERPEQTMLYLNHQTMAHWEEVSIDWRQESMRNLVRRSDPGLYTGTFNRKEGDNSTYYALVFMHPDGYGPSRLLLGEQLERLFPAGYLIGLPEMSCGLALSADATAEERAKIEHVVESCFRDGTRPLVPGLHDPALLIPR